MGVLVIVNLGGIKPTLGLVFIDEALSSPHTEQNQPSAKKHHSERFGNSREQLRKVTQ